MDGRGGVLAICLVLAALAGCLGSDAAVCVNAQAHALTGPLDASGNARIVTDRPVPVLFWVNNSATEPLYISVGLEDTDGGFEMESFSDPGAIGTPAGAIAFGVTRIDPASATDPIFEAISDRRGERCSTLLPDIAIKTTPAQEQGEQVRAGIGVLVHTAGFWTNGTLFYTNMDRVDQDHLIPTSPIGRDYGGGDPLKVYVYNNSREEMPQRYEQAGFFTTITGFNRALKQMITGSSHVALLAPEDAYTVEGREDHQLYGDALVFYMEAVELARVPCAVPGPGCALPSGPPDGKRY